MGLVGYCQCFTGYGGRACEACASGFVGLGAGNLRRCVFLPGALTSCSDGVRNGNEAGVDCGGPNCGPCPELPAMDGAGGTKVL